MVAAPMLFTTATASSTTKMTTSRDAIVKCDLISVEGETYEKEDNVFRTMLPKLERGLEVVESLTGCLVQHVWRWACFSTCCIISRISVRAFWCSPQGSSYCLSRPRRLLET